MEAMLPLKPESICVDINKLVTDCTAAHHNMLSVLTVIAIVMTLTATRFKRALETNATLPKKPRRKPREGHEGGSRFSADCAWLTSGNGTETYWITGVGMSRLKVCESGVLVVALDIVCDQCLPCLDPIVSDATGLES